MSSLLVERILLAQLTEDLGGLLGRELRKLDPLIFCQSVSDSLLRQLDGRVPISEKEGDA